MKLYSTILTFLLWLVSAGVCVELNMLIKMSPDQEQYFKDEILDRFREENGIKVNISHFASNWELLEKLKERGKSYDIIKVPMSMARPLVGEDLIKPLDEIITHGQVDILSSAYFKMDMAEVRGKVYYVPRKYETRIMVYLRSQVKEAVANWKKMQGKIEKELQNAIGQGLPKKYQLEKNPSQWDFYDILVAGYYWAKTPHRGKREGRVAHRGKEYSGTALGLMDRSFQMGAAQEDILDPSSAYLTQALLWESLYAGAGVYNQKSWEKGWNGYDLCDAFKRGQIFLSFLTQVDCFNLHERKSGDILNPHDLGFSVLPKAIYMKQNTGRKRCISTGGWLWGIGATTKNARPALALIAYITNELNHAREAEQFGMIPVLKEMMISPQAKFKEKWKNDVFQTSFTQMLFNGTAYLPHSNSFDKLEKAYVAIWKEVVTSSIKGPLSEKKIEEIQANAGFER